MKKLYSSRGLSTKEVLGVVSVCVVLIVIILSLNKQQTAGSRDAQRLSDMTTIANAVARRISDNSGVFEGKNIANGKVCPALPTEPLTITADTYITTRSVGLDCLVSTYLDRMPYDPTIGSGVNTGYEIFIDANKKINLRASAPESTIPRTTPLNIMR